MSNPVSEHGYEIVRREKVKKSQEYRFSEYGPWMSGVAETAEGDFGALVEVRSLACETVPWYDAVGRETDTGEIVISVSKRMGKREATITVSDPDDLRHRLITNETIVVKKLPWRRFGGRASLRARG